MQESFIKFALEKKVLQFGDFTTKAGRKSPYFFNLGSFSLLIFSSELSVDALSTTYKKKFENF